MKMIDFIMIMQNVCRFNQIIIIIIVISQYFYKMNFNYQLDKLTRFLKKYERVSTLDVIYMFLSHLLGLNKTLDFRFGFCKETLMAFFFLLGLLQRNI
ncbi:unnamed protein product [Paramecium sonneborni]|uniref:Uncharacterized protein n=1 Tax=Paramecium sonneborni TaxID=65129 RepID=A0A8S1PSQ8_9CILI|nr:unnamed protein product [Paramecium sonneborni]